MSSLSDPSKVKLSDYPYLSAPVRAEAAICHLEYIAEWLECITYPTMAQTDFHLKASNDPVRFDIALQEIIIRLRQTQSKATLALKNTL